MPDVRTQFGAGLGWQRWRFGAQVSAALSGVSVDLERRRWKQQTLFFDEKS